MTARNKCDDPGDDRSLSMSDQTIVLATEAQPVAGDRRVTTACCSYTHRMSTRLQVILSDDEAASLRELAASEGVTVSEWVRRSLREASVRRTSGKVETRLAAIRLATSFEFPTEDIDVMLEQIERGYVE